MVSELWMNGIRSDGGGGDILPGLQPLLSEGSIFGRIGQSARAKATGEQTKGRQTSWSSALLLLAARGAVLLVS